MGNVSSTQFRSTVHDRSSGSLGVYAICCGSVSWSKSLHLLSFIFEMDFLIEITLLVILAIILLKIYHRAKRVSGLELSAQVQSVRLK